ncbi:hypothetical protein BJ546DRAFT_1053550 [Cryomyces antarcticus]
MAASLPNQQSGIRKGSGNRVETAPPSAKARVRNRKKDAGEEDTKRRCVSTACTACRKDDALKAGMSLHISLITKLYRVKEIQGTLLHLRQPYAHLVAQELPTALANGSLQCDGNLPACAACSSVYSSECVYEPNSDSRRRGAYKKTRTLIQAILKHPEDEVPALVRQIRTCESLETVAESISAKEAGTGEEEDEAISPFSNA